MPAAARAFEPAPRVKKRSEGWPRGEPSGGAVSVPKRLRLGVLRQRTGHAADRSVRLAREQALLLVAVPASASDIVVAEYELKAEYVWRFTLFIEWPEGAAAEAGGPFGDGLERIERCLVARELG